MRIWIIKKYVFGRFCVDAEQVSYPNAAFSNLFFVIQTHGLIIDNIIRILDNPLNHIRQHCSVYAISASAMVSQPRIMPTTGSFNDGQVIPNARHSDDGLRTANFKYVASDCTDMQFATDKLATDWDVLGVVRFNF